MNGARTHRLVVLLVLAGSPCGRPLMAGPPPVSTGEARLASGRTVRYVIHYDRNALRDSVRLDDALIGLTTAGTLLRFDLPDVRFRQEHIGDEAVACLGRGDGGSVLAGLSDGRICRVDPASLALTELARVPSPPQWVGWSPAAEKRPAGLVVVARGTKMVESGGKRWDIGCSVVHDLAAEKVYPTDDTANAFLLDRAGRLWLGADHGEWAGSVTRVRLDRGSVERIAPVSLPGGDGQAFWAGVYGFVELRDGQVWAFGGTSHMGFNSGAITRIDEGIARTLYEFNLPGRSEHAAKPDPNQPRMPFTHIVEEKDSLLVLSYSDVFRVDRSLKDWQRTATLEIRYRWGRPDAMGAYPSIRAVHPPNRPGEGTLFATAADGFIVLLGADAISKALTGQLGAPEVGSIENSVEGTLVADDRSQLPWKLGPTGWSLAAVAPPLELDPLDDFAGEHKEWFKTCVLVGPDGAIVTVSGTAMPGTRTTARRRNGKSERIGREALDLDPSQSFITPDGSLWNSSPDGPGLGRFRAGRWEILTHENAPIGHVKPINADGPPWVLLDQPLGTIWRLDPGGGGVGPSMKQIQVREHGTSLAVHDAITGSDGMLLLATDVGLRQLNVKTVALSPSRVPGPASVPTALARDGLGRVWIGTAKGLCLSAPKATVAEAFEGVPWINRAEVHALVPDPQHSNGVIAALGARGVAFLRVDEPH